MSDVNEDRICAAGIRGLLAAHDTGVDVTSRDGLRACVGAALAEADAIAEQRRDDMIAAAGLGDDARPVLLACWKAAAATASDVWLQNAIFPSYKDATGVMDSVRGITVCLHGPSGVAELAVTPGEALEWFADIPYAVDPELHFTSEAEFNKFLDGGADYV